MCDRQIVIVTITQSQLVFHLLRPRPNTRLHRPTPQLGPISLTSERKSDSQSSLATLSNARPREPSPKTIPILMRSPLQTEHLTSCASYACVLYFLVLSPFLSSPLCCTKLIALSIQILLGNTPVWRFCNTRAFAPHLFHEETEHCERYHSMISLHLEEILPTMVTRGNEQRRRSGSWSHCWSIVRFWSPRGYRATRKAPARK